MSIMFKESAFKHRIKREDILCAFHNDHFDGPVEDEENKFLRLGFDRAGNLLEIMYNETEFEVTIFHAMACRSIYYQLIDS